MRASHFLRDDMTAGRGNEPPWRIGEERRIKGKIKLYERGYHSSPTWKDALVYAPGNMACIVDVSNPVDKDETKQVSRKRKLIAARNAERVLRAWACDCSERALTITKVMDERSWNVIKITRLHNEGKASKEELIAAWAAAWDVAWDAAWVAEIKWQKGRLDWYMNKLFEGVK